MKLLYCIRGIRLKYMKIVREITVWSLVFITFLISGCGKIGSDYKPSVDIPFFVGTYTKTGSKGIYLCKLDTITGELKSVGLAASANQPAFLHVSMDDNFLWAVQEGVGESDSAIAYAIETSSNRLIRLNQVAIKGSGGCYISATYDHNYLLTSCYTSGSTSLIPLNASGEMDTVSYQVRYNGKGLIPSRQEASHCHSIRQDNGGYIYTADLGTDMIYIQKIIGDSLLNIDKIFVAPGSGPRHISFDPKGKYMAVVNELNSSVELYVKGSKSYFSKRQLSSLTVPAGYAGKNTAADIHFSSNGRFLYVSNRGHESIACFEVLRQQESLRLIEYMRDQVKQPRNFSLDPTGRFLLVANQSKNTITSYMIEKETGIPIYTGSFIAVMSPVCVKFLNQDDL